MLLESVIEYECNGWEIWETFPKTYLNIFSVYVISTIRFIVSIQFKIYRGRQLYSEENWTPNTAEDY